MKIYNWVMIDIATGNIIDEDSFEYQDKIVQCKGGSGGSSSGPPPLDQWMQSGPYSWLKNYFGDINQQYDPMQALQGYLGEQGNLESALQNELTGTGGSLAQQRDILGQMQTPEMMRASMQPYLSSAYSNIGQAGIPSSSYADKLISSAVTQGWLSNTNNALSGWGNIGSQVGNLTDKLGTLQSNVYNMKTQPVNWISDIQKLRMGSTTSKSSGGGKGGFLGI